MFYLFLFDISVLWPLFYILESIVYYFQPLPFYVRTVISNLTDLLEHPEVFVVVILTDFFSSR